MRDCSFSPKLDDNSLRMVSADPFAVGPVGDRLYKDFLKRQEVLKFRQRQTMEPEVGAVPVINERSKKLQLGNVFDRLYNHAEKSGARRRCSNTQSDERGRGYIIRAYDIR